MEQAQRQTSESINAGVAAAATSESNSANLAAKDMNKAGALTSGNVTSAISSSQRSNRSRKVTSSKQPATNSTTGGGAAASSSVNRSKQQQRAEYHPPSASSKQQTSKGGNGQQRSMRSTARDGGFEENKQAATLGSCQSNNSLPGPLSKKESAISIKSSTQGAANSKNGVSSKAGTKHSKKRNQVKAQITTSSVNCSSGVADERKSHSRQTKNRNGIMIKSTSSISVRDESVAGGDRIKNKVKSQKARAGSSHQAEGRDKVASSDMLKTSINKQSMKSISNFNQSHKTDKRSNSVKQEAISQKALENIIGANEAREPQESPELLVDGQDIENANGQVESQMSSPQPATNMPASPASKAPTQKNSTLETPNLGQQQQPDDRIEELAEQECSPMSADPIAAAANAVKITNDQTKTGAGGETKMSAFGIKLKKLEVSNMSLSKEAEQDPTRQASLLEATTDSIIVETSPNKEQEVKFDKDGKAVRPEMTEPLPILPKVTTVLNLPVKCPIENIRFLNLKRFIQFQKQAAEQMAAGFDEVGNRRKMIQRQTEDKIKKWGAGAEQLAKIDDTTHFIKSVIYARDPKIIDQERQHVPQREAFQHLNNLDVKMLIQKNQLLNLNEEGKYASLSPRTRRLPQNNQNRPQLDCQVYRLRDAEDKTLLFESRFESGNLYLAQKVSEVEYNLLMQNDINTQGHTQWFFFQVKNTRAGSKIKFNILNYSKPDSLFNYGMKISVYSEKKSEAENTGWHKDGEDIRYFMNGIRKDVTNYARSYYTATFTYSFGFDDDTVFFAYSVPYTYSDLRNDITAIESDPHRSKLVRKATLCRTLSGEQCEVLTITSADNLENFSKRKGVVITARVHPGETVGSWMMRGVLTFLTDPDNYEARMLRQNFVFKVIPMLNPDGVINGNYRCSLAGCDLNRRWKVPNKTLHPTIWHCKRLVKQIHQERGLVMFCDLHGHSRKQNVFMYGCNNKHNPGECRIFPFILGQMNPYFCYDYSRFGVQKSKESTARVALYKELLDVPNIFTMESSFAGCDEGPAAGKHLTTDMLETLGHDSCRAILIYCNMYVPPELHDIPFFKNLVLQMQAAKKKNAGELDKKKFKEPAFNIKDAINSELNANKALLAGSGGDDSSSGSDSAPSEDNMQAEELVKQLPVADKTLKQQLKKNEQKRKQEDKEKAQAEQSQAKLRKQSSMRKEDRDAPKRQLSPLKRAPVNINADKKEDTKAEEKKKPKVETRDACTQTDRSDYQLIKQKMLKERQLKEEQAALAQNQQMRAKAGVSNERQIINDMNGSNRQQQYPKGSNFNTTQRLQQMVGLQESNQARGNKQAQQQMPLSSHFQQNPLMSQKQGGQFNRNGMPMTHPQSTRNEQSSLLGLTGGQPPQNINQLDKKKYNFMGVSSINQSGSPQQNNENEYGTVQPQGDTTPSGMFQGSTTNGEFPAMTTTLSANSSKQSGNKNLMNKNHPQMKQPASQQQPLLTGPMSINSMLNGGGGAQNAPQDQNGPPGSQRIRNDAAFSPMRKGTGSTGQNAINTAQLSLPHAKQLPQKEFVMLEVGKAAKGVRKGSRNPKSTANNLQLMGSQNPNSNMTAVPPSSGNGQPTVGNTSASQNHYNSMSKQFNNSTGNHRQFQPMSSENSEQQDTQSSRFQRSQPPQTQGAIAGQQKQLVSLVRNNSMVVNNANANNNNSEATPVVRSSPADQYSSQLQEMSLSQTLVTRNTPGGTSPQKPGSNQDMGMESGQYRAALSGALAPQAQNSNLARYKAAVGGDGKLPALNVRGGGSQQPQQPKSVRSEFANSSGVIGGLNIVLSSGQGSLQTPQQKKPNPPTFQMSAHSQKIHPNNVTTAGGPQPKLVGPSMHITSHAGPNASPHQAVSSNAMRQKSDSKMGLHGGGKQPHAQMANSTNNPSRQKQHWQSHTCENPQAVKQGGSVARQNQLGAGSQLQIQTSSATHKRNMSQRPIFIGAQTTTAAGGGTAGLQPGSLSHESGQITMRQQAEQFQASANQHAAGPSLVGPPPAISSGGNKKQRTHLLSNNSMSGANNNHQPLQGKVVGKRYSRH